MSVTGQDLLLGRHEVTNTLLRYLRAVDDQDTAAVSAALGGAEVSFDGVPLDDADRGSAYRSVFASSGRTRHLLHAVEVTWRRPGLLVGRASYQRWSLTEDAAHIAAIGDYEVHLEFSTTGVRLVRFTVHRVWQHSGALNGQESSTTS